MLPLPVLQLPGHSTLWCDVLHPLLCCCLGPCCNGAAVSGSSIVMRAMSACILRALLLSAGWLEMLQCILPHLLCACVQTLWRPSLLLRVRLSTLAP